MREKGLVPMYVCVCDIESMCSMRGCIYGVVRLWLGWSCEGEWVACVGGFWRVRKRVGCVCVRERVGGVSVGVCVGLCAYGWVGVVSGLRAWVGAGGCERGVGCVCE